MLIYSDNITERLRYTLHLVFNQLLDIEYQLTTDKELYLKTDQFKLNYSRTVDAHGIHIYPADLLFESGIHELNPQTLLINGRKIIFPTDCEFGFDIFAAVFYMVSRYEEYLPYIPDEHGRFCGKDSYAYKNGFIKVPVVNIWVQDFANFLTSKYPDLIYKKGKFSVMLTYDIDVAYKYLGRGIIKSAAGTIKDLIKIKCSNIVKRFLAIINSRKDPWDVYDALLYNNEEFDRIFFFLLSSKSTIHDKNLPGNNQLQNALINKIQNKAQIGIHPSYYSWLNPEKMNIEKSRLEDISGKNIFKSRQHYLRLKLPDTYKYLLQAGIKEDFSLGFADKIGFRAGICTPFYFYDLSSEMATSLLIYPITYMDATLFKYEKLNVDQANEVVTALIEQVKSVNGTFISLWHNHTLSHDKEFKGWKNVYEKMIFNLKALST